MNQPEALVHLIEDLGEQRMVSHVETTDDSKAVIYIDSGSASKDDGIDLSAIECQLLFATPKCVKKLRVALGSPKRASLVIYDLVIPDEALEALEAAFIAVDEG